MTKNRYQSVAQMWAVQEKNIMVSGVTDPRTIKVMKAMFFTGLNLGVTCLMSMSDDDEMNDAEYARLAVGMLKDCARVIEEFGRDPGFEVTPVPIKK